MGQNGMKILQTAQAQNSLNRWIEGAKTAFDLSRDQIRFILTDKLNDMSKVDVVWEYSQKGEDENP